MRMWSPEPMSRSKTQRLLARKVRPGEARLMPDDLIVEEPLSIELDGHLVASTMRTPGSDFELAAGFCLSDGLVGPGDIRQIRYCRGISAVSSELNVVSVDTGGRVAVPARRLGLTSSSCGPVAAMRSTNSKGESAPCHLMTPGIRRC